jgi:hypothetical protein
VWLALASGMAVATIVGKQERKKGGKKVEE